VKRPGLDYNKADNWFKNCMHKHISNPAPESGVRNLLAVYSGVLMDAHAAEQIQRLLDYQFKDTRYLEEAFLHSSIADNRLSSNERMEFLGDSVLSLVICKTLFMRFPEYQEGDLTKIKSRLVSRKTCADVANEMGLPAYIKVGKGMDRTRAMTGSIAAANLESVIGAIFLDGGMEPAERFILKLYDPLIAEADAEQHQENFKSLLQQHCQQEFNCTPLYDLLDEKGARSQQVLRGGRRDPAQAFSQCLGRDEKRGRAESRVQCGYRTGADQPGTRRRSVLLIVER
jgi:ribonuclease III